MRRPFLVPEVIQSSAMDCGPAALKGLLAGFGVDINYDRLREACQTSVDGTSIDTLEQLANDLGVEATQQMLPEDALFEHLRKLAPCILVTSIGVGNAPHFVVIWSWFAGRFQVMDPAVGRRWLTPDELRKKLYLHTQSLHGEDWSRIMTSGPFLTWLEGRLDGLGMKRELETFLAPLRAPKAWRKLSAADAAARTVSWLLSTGQVTRGAQSSRLFHHCFELGLQEISNNQRLLPPAHWFARPVRQGKPLLTMRGVVLLVPSGKTRPVVAASGSLAAQIKDVPWSIPGALLSLLRRSDALAIGALVGALLLGALGALAEVMIYRASSSLIQRLGILHQRLTAIAAFGLFLLLLLLLDLLVLAFAQRLGRHSEGRLRLLLLEKLPKLPDSYFRSRLLSDLALRAHTLYSLRSLPLMLQDLLRSGINLTITVAAISLLQPSIALLAVVGAVLSVLLPSVAHRWVYELEDRLQNQSGVLSSLFLDVLAGLVPIRTHGAERAMFLEQQRLLADWFRSAVERQRVMTWITASQTLFGSLLAIGLVYGYSQKTQDPQGLLLLLFWAQRLPSLGQAVSQGLAGLAPVRSSMGRVFEMLRGQEEVLPAPLPGEVSTPHGARLRFENVHVMAGGQEILKNLTLTLKAGEHVAIVGQSGAGKSSLLALLLGLHKICQGRLWLDGEELSSSDLFQRLQPTLSWVDPTVQLWNDSLLTNIQFGSQNLPQRPIAQVVSQSDLLGVLDRLPEGFRTQIGDGGALLSGGEGQRVRLARALLKRDTRLALLDEPFRGLDRGKRRTLLARLRSLWADSTLICVTHDVADTKVFPRVLVVEEGSIIEDGSPEELLSWDSRYRSLLEADQRAASGVWSAAHWRRISVHEGRVVSSEHPS